MFLLDGIFLLRPELLDAWDFRVFVTVVSQEIIRRARILDTELYGSPRCGRAEVPRPVPASPATLPPHIPAGQTRRHRARERRPSPVYSCRAESGRGEPPPRRVFGACHPTDI